MAVLRVLAWWLPLPFAAWAVARVFGLERGFPLVQLMAFTPYIAGFSLVPVTAALLLRRSGAAALSAITALALIATVLPRAVPDGQPVPTGPGLRVLSANTLAGSADPESIVELVRRLDVDVLALQEITPRGAARLAAAGLGGLLPHSQANPLWGVGGSALYSRFPLRDGGFRLNPAGFGQSFATVDVPGAPEVRVESVHPCAPYNGEQLRCWAAGLAGQPAATRKGPIRVLAGDFNATLDHAALRRLRATGYRDAADAVGAGFAGTWGPYDGDRIPPVTIDHVLVDRRVRVEAVSVHPIAGSDHRAVFADLTLPSG